MEQSFKDAIMNRRSCYALSNVSPINDQQIRDIVELAVRYVPSAFNSQTTRAVILLGSNHLKLWSIVLKTLHKIVPEAAFESTRAKISSFAAGYGTVLFFEDQMIVDTLQSQFPLYADNFPGWSLQTSAMHQFSVWTMLENAGLGASIQHYNPLIDSEVASQWELPTTWKLIAQMPFGTPIDVAGAKSFEPLSSRVLMF